MRENKEKSNIGKNRYDKNIDVEDAFGDRERFNKMLVGVESSESFSEGGFPDVIESDLSTYDYTQVTTLVTKW